MFRQVQRLAVGSVMLAVLQAGAVQAGAIRPDDDQLVLATIAPQSVTPQQMTVLAADRGNLELALTVARAAIEQGRANADPRAYGEAEAALEPWWKNPHPPQQVRMLRAIIAQANHEFAKATADLDAILEASPRNAQARLSRAFLRMVTGQIDDAMSDCSALPYSGRGLIRSICLARAAALSGEAGKGKQLLQRALATGQQADPAMQRFALSVLADLEAGLGLGDNAATFYAAATSEASPDVFTLAAYADLLLDTGRPGDVLRLLDGKGEQDALLLRRAIAAKRSADPRLGEWTTLLNERFAAAAAAGNRVHLREEALFRLAVENNAGAALPLAVQNWSLQKEPADARILIEAALAAGRPASAQPVADFIAATKLDDARLKPLLARLESK